MSSIISLNGQQVTVTVSDILVELFDSEFRGNIDFTITFAEPVASKDVVQALSLRILPSSQHHEETLNVVGYAEVDGGVDISMHWDTVSREPGDLRSDMLPEIELFWEGYNDTQSIGRFPLKSSAPVETQTASTNLHMGSMPTNSQENSFGEGIPPGIFIEELSRGQTIFVNWFDRGTPYTVVFGIGFTTLPALFGWYTTMMPVGLIFASVFTLIGITIFYYGICKIFNKTIISVENNEIRVDYKPLPWPNSNKPIGVSTIKSVDTKKNRHSQRNSDEHSKTTTYTYAVQIKTNDKKNIPIIKVDSPETALMIKDKLREFLGLGGEI